MSPTWFEYCLRSLLTISVVQRLKFLQPTTQARAAVCGLHVVVKHSIVDFIQFGLLEGGHHIAALHLANELVFGLGQAFGLLVAENLIQLLLSGIASAVNACCFAEPIDRSLDACGGCDLLNGVTQAAWLPATLCRFRCSRFGFVLLHFLGY